ncbi:MAG TPA: hypothetical protein VH253_10735 [Phycisphaerae bacterium]|nr:hypothetical protein [Phycisphaerae bacterium]
MKRRHLILPLPTLLALATFARAADTAVTWDGSTGNWTDSTHWSLPTGEYPNADNPPGSTYAVTINGGTIDLVNANITVDTLTMAEAKLSDGTLTLTGASSISGNSVNLFLHNASTGTLALSGVYVGGELDNEGQLSMTSDVGSGAAVNAGTMTVGGVTFGVGKNAGSQKPTFANTGTIIVDAGAKGVCQVSSSKITDTAYDPTPLFFNSGNVEVRSGTFDMNAADGGSTSGTFTVDAGATLQLNSQLSFAAASSITGSGTVVISNGEFASYSPPPTISIGGQYNVYSTVIHENSVEFNSHAVTNAATITEASVAGAGSLTINGAVDIVDSQMGFSELVLNGSGIVNQTILPSQTCINGTATILLPNSREFPLATNITIGTAGSLTLSASSSQLDVTSDCAIVNNGVLLLHGLLFEGHEGSLAKPVGHITNNGTLAVSGPNGFSGTTVFHNNGLLIVSGGTFAGASPGFNSASGTIFVQDGMADLASITAGTLINHGFIFAGGLFGPNLTFENAGTVGIGPSTTLDLAAPQKPETTGLFYIHPDGILEFAADYDFSSLGGPSIGHGDAATDGLIIVDPGITLTLPSDTAFAGTIDVYGTLVIAPPLNPADAGLSPTFTVVDEVPEPASLGILAVGAPCVLLRPRRRPLP